MKSGLFFSALLGGTVGFWLGLFIALLSGLREKLLAFGKVRRMVDALMMKFTDIQGIVATVWGESHQPCFCLANTKFLSEVAL